MFVRIVTRANNSNKSSILSRKRSFMLPAGNGWSSYGGYPSGSSLTIQLVENEGWMCVEIILWAYSKERNGAGVLLKSPEGNLIPLSYKLEFDSTNNNVEDESLVLGLQATRYLKIECLTVFWKFLTDCETY